MRHLRLGRRGSAEALWQEQAAEVRAEAGFATPSREAGRRRGGMEGLGGWRNGVWRTFVWQRIVVRRRRWPKPLRKAAVALHVSASACGFPPSTGYEVAGRWRGLMAMGLLPQARVEVASWAEHCKKQADSLERTAAKERTKAFRTWGKLATKSG